MSDGVLVVSRVARVGTVHGRVVLSDGRKVKVPMALAKEGTEIRDCEILDVMIAGKVDYIHVSLKKVKRVPKVLKVMREVPLTRMERDKRAKNDYAVIRACVLMFRKHLPNNKIIPEELEDLVSEIYIHFEERGYLDGYDSSRASYTTWIFKGVKNYIIASWRSRDKEFHRSMVHFDDEVNREDKDVATLYDLVADTSVVTAEEELMRAEAKRNFKDIAISMDRAVPYEDGLPSFEDIDVSLRDNVLDKLMEAYVGQYRKKPFMDKLQVFRQRCGSAWSEALTV